MKGIFKCLLFMAAAAVFTSCGNSENSDPVEPPFRLKVYDVSSVTATVEVEPQDKESAYYTDVINEADFLQAQEHGFDDYMSWFIGNMMDQNGLDVAEVVELISSYGNDGFILTSLKPESVYYAFAVGIDERGMTTTEVVYEKFTTSGTETSANQITIAVDDVTPMTASVKTSVTNEDTYILSIEAANVIADLSDDELADYIIQSNIAWGGLENITYSGDSEIDWLGKSGWDYVVVAFGYENGAVTTDVVRKEFAMEDGGDPAECGFTFSQEYADFQMHLTITPSDNSVVYICNYLKMDDLQVLLSTGCTLEEAFGECLEMLIDDMVEDLGTRASVVDLISAMDRQDFSTGYEPSTEYIQWAVPVDQNGTPTASFFFSEPFITPEAAVSDAGLEIVSCKYYNGTELAELYPEFKAAKGYAVIDLVVEPSASAVHWWSYAALEDLTDRSREVIIKNLLSAPTEKDLRRQQIVAFWGVNTVMGVAQDADEVYGPLLLHVVDLKKEEASPASEFAF